ncbi:MAG: YggT family protein [Bacillota bacterium]|nr:YggT family protein [Bacillota bacterium]
MSIFKVTAIYFFQVINFLIFARVVLSWVARGRRNQIIDLVYQLTEPILSPFRQLQEKIGIGGMLDFSPIMALLTLSFILNFLLGL